MEAGGIDGQIRRRPPSELQNERISKKKEIRGWLKGRGRLFVDMVQATGTIGAYLH